MGSFDRILVHYAEIGTKGGNRPFFEKRLIRNLNRALRGFGAGKFRREPGRVSAPVAEGTDVEPLLARAAKVPGVAWVAPAVRVEPDLDLVTEVAVGMALAQEDNIFRVDTRRSHKQFPFDSLAVNRHVGAAIVAATGRKVSLGNPEVTFGIQLDKHDAYIHCDRREGPGGLPVGSEGKLVALLSGGIDSPVAAWLMMVRGCRVHLVHFLNRSFSTNRVVDKVTDLAKVLSEYHGRIELSVLPFDELQREIVMVVPAPFRMIVYRRAMFRIAERVREQTGALGFVTGDSVGQVASQTLENLRVIHAAASYPVYAPLAGTSKRDITALAQRVGTYEISVRPHEDCCSFMVAKHPETRARLEEVEALERFDLSAGIEAVLAAEEHHRIDPIEGHKLEVKQ